MKTNNVAPDTTMTMGDIINGLRHMADDHPCCAPFIEAAILTLDDMDAAEVVAYDGQERTITLRFELMPLAAIGEKWLVRSNAKLRHGARE